MADNFVRQVVIANNGPSSVPGREYDHFVAELQKLTGQLIDDNLLAADERQSRFSIQTDAHTLSAITKTMLQSFSFIGPRELCQLA